MATVTLEKEQAQEMSEKELKERLKFYEGRLGKLQNDLAKNRERQQRLADELEERKARVAAGKADTSSLAQLREVIRRMEVEENDLRDIIGMATEAKGVADHQLQVLEGECETARQRKAARPLLEQIAEHEEAFIKDLVDLRAQLLQRAALARRIAQEFPQVQAVQPLSVMELSNRLKQPWAAAFGSRQGLENVDWSHWFWNHILSGLCRGPAGEVSGFAVTAKKFHLRG